MDLFKEFDSSQMKFNPAIQAKVAKKSPLRVRHWRILRISIIAACNISACHVASCK